KPLHTFRQSAHAHNADLAPGHQHRSADMGAGGPAPLFGSRRTIGTVAESCSRYDAIADWYVEFTSGWPSEPIALLPDNLVGQRVLDLACGYGRAARRLASRGAEVTAVDLSSKLIAHATAIESTQPLGIRYEHGDVTATDWWDGAAFDGVVCNMALMD